MVDTGEKPQISIEMDSSNEIQITGNELVYHFQSDKFKKALTTAEGRMRRSDEDVEQGFKLFRKLRSPDTIIKVAKNVSSLTIMPTDEETREAERLRERGFFNLISVHLHSTTNPYAYVPTIDDIESTGGSREDLQLSGYEGFPLSVIVIPKGRGMMDMLVYQPTALTSTSRTTLDQFDNDTGGIRTVRESLEVLQQYAYKAAVIKYGPQGLSPEDVDVLKSFAFTIKPITPPIL